MQKIKKRINPLNILFIWIKVMIALTPIVMFVSNIGASGGEQKPLEAFVWMIKITIYGAAVFTIIVPFVFKGWFIQHQKFVFVILLAVIPITMDLWNKFSQSPYSSSEDAVQVNGNEVKTKIEYYDDFKTVRSISIWKNEKKDSVWKVFSKDGKIINQTKFHNGKAVK